MTQISADKTKPPHLRIGLRRTGGRSRLTNMYSHFGKKAAIAVVGIASLIAPIAVGMMNAPAKFEVATVKPAEVHDEQLAQRMDFMRTVLPVIGGVTIRGKRVEMRGYTLEQLVCVAFRIRTRQLIGPAWLSGKRFDVEALIPTEASNDQANEMLQTLLQERFALRAHPSTREQAGYVLTVGNGGPHLKVSSPNPPSSSEPPNVESLMARIPKPGLPGSMRRELKRSNMNHVAETLAQLLQSTVEDRTGLNEKYDVVIDIPPPLDSDDKDPQARIFAAVNQLGLHLKSGKVTVQVLVVDSIEKIPTAN